MIRLSVLRPASDHSTLSELQHFTACGRENFENGRCHSLPMLAASIGDGSSVNYNEIVALHYKRVVKRPVKARCVLLIFIDLSAENSCGIRTTSSI